MGLKERRVQEEMKQKFQNDWLQKIQAAAKFPVVIDVRWEMMVQEDNSHYAVESFEDVFVKPMIAAFQDICRDEMGTSALASGLKQVVIKNEKQISNGNDFASFNDGTLTLDHYYANVHAIEDRTKGLINKLSAGL